MSALNIVATVDHPGDAIRERRNELGWTQTELAQRAGVPQADISRLENGRLDARWSTIHRLSVALASGRKSRRSLSNGARRTVTTSTTAEIWKPTSRTLDIPD